MTSPRQPWESGAEWWLEAIADDPIYATDVMPLLRKLTAECAGPWLDVGCGEGRAQPALPLPLYGCDVATPLLTHAVRRFPVVRCRLPDLRFIRDGALGGASLVLVLEHLPDLAAILTALHSCIRPAGHLAVVLNHPAFTAPGSGPIVDPADGEVLWRWGSYFDAAITTMWIGGQKVSFHHRPVGVVLSVAAAAGWVLELVDERPLGAEAVRHEPGYAGQEQVPRLIGLRWRR